jgi:pimeloyl-ACP methyl ester carboxylesterase
MSGPGNPLEKTHASSLPEISSNIYPIAGILTTVYGLSELPANISELACLWLLHPRLQTQASMAPLAAQAIHNWNSRRGNSRKGLIAISFDQRNHGSRLVDKMANEAWRQGNERHAQDMFSCYQGTSQDCSLLLTHISSYLPQSLPQSSSHIVLGISLGGHAAWHSLLHDPRITAGVVIIGCPDFQRLMLQRAEKSRRKTFGPKFLGSSDFPAALIASVDTSDPAGLFLPANLKGPSAVSVGIASVIPSSSVQASTTAILTSTLQNKKILLQSGGADKLVPYACGEPFLRFLKAAIGGWWKNNGLVLDDRVYEGVGHETTPRMAKEAVEWIGDVLAGDIRVGGVKESRI